MKKHKYDYKWGLSSGYPADRIEKNNLKVFGTFICGGGSSMGYKLAGFEHLGGVEIDPKIADVYKTNHNPKYLFIEDIRDFAKMESYPEELMKLDILDGSPPCSSFSKSGNREKDWGKKKIFKEGQALQTLDDLFFDYIKLAKKLQPKVVIAENVKGLIQGNAKSYVRRIKKEFENAGYKVQLFLLNSASMGVPQKRERVFFICQRNDMNFGKLELKFDEKPIPFGMIDGKLGKEICEHDKAIWDLREKGEHDFSETLMRTRKKQSNWNTKYIHKNKVLNTITAGAKLINFDNPNYVSNEKLIKCSTFPEDYNFKNIEPKYIMGMSVPPVMMAQISHQIYLQWFEKQKSR